MQTMMVQPADGGAAADGTPADGPSSSDGMEFQARDVELRMKIGWHECCILQQR